jgi:hypothetical protein
LPINAKAKLTFHRGPPPNVGYSIFLTRPNVLVELNFAVRLNCLNIVGLLVKITDLEIVVARAHRVRKTTLVKELAHKFEFPILNEGLKKIHAPGKVFTDLTQDKNRSQPDLERAFWN